MPLARSKKKKDFPPNIGAQKSPLWWYEHREELAWLSAKAFAEKHRCGLKETRDHQKQFSEVEFFGLPIQKGSKPWWELHFEELNFLSVLGFAFLHDMPVERVEMKKKLLLRDGTLKQEETRLTDWKNSANFLWLKFNHLELEELSQQDFSKEYAPTYYPEDGEETSEGKAARLNLSPPKFPKSADLWWRKHLGELEKMTVKDFREKYRVSLSEIKYRIRYSFKTGKLKQAVFLNFYRQTSHFSPELTVLAHFDDFETMRQKQFIEKYQITFNQYRYFRGKFHQKHLSIKSDGLDVREKKR
jgi:hypothetical protein